MKKTLFLFLFAFLFVSGTFAQFGIKVGANTTTMNITSTDNLMDNVKNANWGFNVGAFYRLKIAIVYLQPEVYFSTVQGNFKYGDDPNNLKNYTLDLNRIDVPLLAGVKLGPIRAMLGPVAFFNISKKSSLTNFDEAMKNTTWGYQAGVGIDLLKKLTIDARFEGSLGNLTKSVEIDGTTIEPSTKSSAILLSVGWMF